MESETREYDRTLSEEDQEGQDREWLSIAEAERTAYRTKALAQMAEAMRTTKEHSGEERAAEKSLRDRRNQILFHGKGDGLPSQADYEAAATALAAIETSSGKTLDRIEDFLASAQLDLLAMRMMQRDRRDSAE